MTKKNITTKCSATNTESDLCLGQEFTIYQAQDIYKTLVERLQNDIDIRVDLSEIEEIDTSAVQLLLMIDKELHKRGKVLIVENCSHKASSCFSAFNISFPPTRDKEK